MIDMVALITKIEAEEGYEPKIYKCPAGYWTIGAGINLETTPIPKRLADDWRANMLKRRIDQLESFSWFHTLNAPRQLVIVDMAYQLGTAGLLRFQKMIQAIIDYDYELASTEMLDSKWARQDSPNRANRNAKIMREGIE